ncbi:MAG: hypothetical protein J6U90_04985 [Methanobrevibacter sp.]|nr:hypothetical protein [Methanobrevibacter sp.]
MEKQEFLDKITAIGTCEDDVERRTLLSELQESVSADYDSMADLTAKNTDLTAEIKKVKEHNMDLFLQVTSNNKELPPDAEKDEPEEKLSFDDLFDEKGGLK